MNIKMNIYKDVSLIIISHKENVLNFLEKISNIKIIVVENSEDQTIKEDF